MGRKKERRNAPAKAKPAPAPAVDPFESRSLPIQIGFAVAVLGVYVVSLYPSVPGGDSGELIVAARQLGIAHPPGYPTFTLLGKLFSLLPIGTVAWRVNLLTAVMGALAATLLMRSTWRLTSSLGGGLVAGGLFAFSPLVWRWSIEAEVFSTNNFFAAWLLFLLVSYEKTREPRTLYTLLFVFGLGLTNHHTLVLYGAPIVIWVFLRAGDWTMRVDRLARCVGAFALGLVPYLYLFVSPADHPSMTWRHPMGLGDFTSHLTRQQYGTFQLSGTDTEADLVQSLSSYLAQLPGELLYVGLLLAVIGLGLAFVRNQGTEPVERTVVKVSLFLLAFYLLIFESMANLPVDDPIYYDVHSRFWQQPNLIVCLLAGVGFAWLVERRLALGARVAAATALILVVLQAGLHYKEESQRHNRLVADLAKKTLEALPLDALVISKGDLYWSSLRYQQVVERVRPDVRVLDVEALKAPWTKALIAEHYPEIELPGEVYRSPGAARANSFDLLALFRANMDRFPIYSNALGHDDDDSWQAEFVAWPEGVYDRIYRTQDPVSLDHYLSRARRWMREVTLESPGEARRGSWDELAWKEYLTARSRPGTRLLNYAVTHALGQRYLDEAGQILQEAFDSGERLDSAVYLNLGIYYYLSRDARPEAVPRMVDAWTQFLATAADDDPSIGLVRTVLADPENAEINIGGRR